MAIICNGSNSLFMKKYQIKDVTHAIGMSESAISAYFNNRKISVAKGITLQQIAEMCADPSLGKRSGYPNWDNVHEVEDLLKKYYGITIIRENETK